MRKAKNKGRASWGENALQGKKQGLAWMNWNKFTLDKTTRASQVMDANEGKRKWQMFSKKIKAKIGR